ncbi:Leucine-rich repeat flightless-interacting protein 2 [Pteropus alecto]|uniref:Leucine-rich repeat flightless-interacting protein 2 n=1 Tax=Pteropus alecto TaxID=9402 RepID=L5KSG1_PTEAL|nr:Leucine-rich repeat flightless-interacting protein 2 [Pteropus alecto]
MRPDAAPDETSMWREADPTQPPVAEFFPRPVCGLIRCDIRLKKLVDERECLLQQVKKLKGQLEERQKHGKLDTARPGDDILENGTDLHGMDLQRDANRQISDLKFKLAKSEQEITALEQNLRSALDKTEELEVSNGHLVKRLEKMKANRSVLLSHQ